MLHVSSAQLNAWMAMLLWPATRILAALSVAPLFGHINVPATVKLGLGLLVSLAIAPALPALPDIEPLSAAGVLILVQQMLIGLAIGFSMKLVFTGIEMAGELATLTMGLSFASFYDPNSQAQSSSLSQWFGWLALMVFVSSNLHLAWLVSLTDSFHSLPISGIPMGTGSFNMVTVYGGKIFTIGLQLSLPVIGALLVTNLALGLLTKAAPQLNLFGIGFPITIGAGFLMICLCLPYLSPALTAVVSAGISLSGALAQ